MALTSAIIQNAYIAFFNRPADVPGLSYWQRHTGNDQDLLIAFSKSEEYTSDFIGLTNSQMLDKVYKNLFNRNPDVTGKSYWLSEMSLGHVTLANVAWAVMEGAQGTDANVMTNKQNAATAFTSALDSPEKIAAYNNAGNNGIANTTKEWLTQVGTNSITLNSAKASINTVIKTLTDTNVNIPSTGTGSTFGNDTLYGTTGNDNLSGGDGNDRIWGNSGDDTLSGEMGNDELEGGTGNDSLYGGSGRDELEGNAGDDILYGGNDNDELEGGSGNDILYGEDGNDDLEGDSGNDVLVGGSGNDCLEGDSGNDQYLLYTGSGVDRISNYDTFGFDLIYFKDITLSNVTAISHGRNLVIHYGENDSVTINNYFLGENYQIDEFVFEDVTLAGVDFTAMFEL